MCSGLHENQTNTRRSTNKFFMMKNDLQCFKKICHWNILFRKNSCADFHPDRNLEKPHITEFAVFFLHISSIFSCISFQIYSFSWCVWFHLSFSRAITLSLCLSVFFSLFSRLLCVCSALAEALALQTVSEQVQARGSGQLPVVREEDEPLNPVP